MTEQDLADLRRWMAEREGWRAVLSEVGLMWEREGMQVFTMPDYLADWSLMGPVIEREIDRGMEIGVCGDGSKYAIYREPAYREGRVPISVFYDDVKLAACLAIRARETER